MPKDELPKAYQAKDWENKLYALWDESGFFNPDTCIEKGYTQADAEPFSVLMPPPNVTGVLHLGHAMENAIMDTMARYKRMQGYRTLYLPGADHAAVATQARVEKNLMEEGYQNPRQELGREQLLEKIRAFADQSKETIVKQIRAMGSSCDWSRFAYTFDAPRERAVNTVFKKMYDDGLIYKGYRVVNWSVKGQSTASDDELVYIERPATLYTFRYSKDFPLSIATTRPETKLGDTAVAVHPEDTRYQSLIGQTFTVDLGAKEPLEIKIIGDESVDPTFGTGAVGVTPAHSQADFEMYERHPEIKLIPVIGEDGRMNENAGKSYQGLESEKAREKFVAWLREQGLLENEEEITQNVGTSDRFGDVIEVLPKHQWFIDVNKEIPGRRQSLKDLMRSAVATDQESNTSQKIAIQPERFRKNYLHWIDNLRPWCISRQIWWGHRIPVWYRGEEICCSVEPPSESGWEQDPDTLDTWFSSGLWTFSTLGWPEDTKDLSTYHPTSFMQMGHELLFFWMARMILMTTYALNEIPFYDVYIHGILRDKDGRKFSKSLGNGIDPLEVSAEYGTDALRLALLSDITPGNDARFSYDKLTVARNFVNKLWNISRYALLSEPGAPQEPSLADRYILERLAAVTKEVTGQLDKYQIALAIETLRDFTLNDFADWYVEINKIEKNGAVLRQVLETLLRLWHPFLPFITEALWSHLDQLSLLMVSHWPERQEAETSRAQADFALIKSFVTKIRNLRSRYRIAPKAALTVIMEEHPLFRDHQALLEALASVTLEFASESADLPGSVRLVDSGYAARVPLEGVVDLESEKNWIAREQEETEKHISSLSTRLADESFRSKAPQNIIDAQEATLADLQKKLRELENARQELS